MMNKIIGAAVLLLCFCSCVKDNDAIYYPVGNVDIEKGGPALEVGSNSILVAESYNEEDYVLDTLDEQILKLIADNARIPFLEVARACNVSGAAIHQRIQKLTNLGILKGSEYVIDPEKIGYETCAYIGIYLKDPASFDAVTRALEAIPEIVECHFTTGKYDMFIKLYARNNHHLLSIIHDKLQPLGLARTETLISFHEAIKRQMPITVEEEED